MKKRNLPTGINRKRWIEKLSDEDYKNLSKEDRESLKRFQTYSRMREQKTKTLNELRIRVKKLKEDISELDGKEESNFVKVQHLHTIMGCRIELTRQKFTPKSIVKNSYTYGGTLESDRFQGSQPYTMSKHYVRKTYRGEKLGDRFIYFGKIKSKNLKKPKSCYFQTEKKLFTTIRELKGIDLSKSKSPKKSVEREILPHYKEYVITLMRSRGIVEFEKRKVSFSDFITWYKKHKIEKR
jgi:hypothetical protein